MFLEASKVSGDYVFSPGRGCAKETIKDLPRSFAPFILACALSAASAGISTKPNPLERPVCESVIMRMALTSPNSLKICLSSAVLVSHGKLPT